jgi:hypothetical protein
MMKFELTVKNGWIARDMDGDIEFCDKEPTELDHEYWKAGFQLLFSSEAENLGLDKLCQPGEAVKYENGEIVDRKYLPGRNYIHEGFSPTILSSHQTTEKETDKIYIPYGFCSTLPTTERGG